MTLPDNRIGPAGNGANSKITVQAISSSVAATDVPFGLTPRAEWEFWLEAYMHGYADGIDHGRCQMDAELATLQRTAAEVVHAMAALPERDREADMAAAVRREARWSR